MSSSSNVLKETMSTKDTFLAQSMLSQRVNTGVSLAILCLVCMGYILNRNIEEIRTTSNRRALARQTAFKIKGLYERIVDAETGQRGYLLTGRKLYLAPYEEALRQIPQDFAELEILLAEQTSNLKQLSEIKQLTDEKLKELKTTIHLQETTSKSKALAIVKSDHGHNLMKGIRLISHQLEIGLQEQIAQRNEEMDQIINQSTIVLTLGSGFALLLMIIFLFVVARNTKRSSKIESSLRANNTELVSNQILLSKVIDIQNKIATAPLNSKTVMAIVAEQSLKLTESDGAIIEISEGEDLVYHHVHGAAASFLGLRIKKKGSFSGLCLDEGKSLLCSDSEIDERVNREACRKVNLRSMIVVPLHHGKKVVGVLKNYSAKPNHFNQQSCNTLSLISGMLATAMAQASEFEEKNALVTALEKTKSELIASKELAESATEAKSRFLATMSHEYRTPLNGILGMTSLLLDKSLSHEQEQYVSTIKNSGEVLLRLVNDALDFSKIEAGQLKFELLDFDLVSTLQDLKKSFEFLAQQKGLEFQLEVDSKIPLYLKGDPGRIRQILTNLIGNALKFTSSGFVKVKVRRLDSTSNYIKLHFEIKDSGIGISNEDVQKLFQEFAQADASTTRRYGGTGLGLSICKRLVEMMDGNIGVSSLPELGSTFWFTLNLLPGSETVHETSTNNDTDRAQLHLRVLVAEDNQVNQLIITKILEKLGAQCLVVGNGKEVIDALQATPFQLVLMDCNMPEMDGYEATHLIRAKNLVPDKTIPIIAMTANAMRGDAERCLDAGMDDYLSKPLNFKKVSEVLLKWQGIIESRKVKSA